MEMTKSNKEEKVISEKKLVSNGKKFTEQPSHEAPNKSINIHEIAKWFNESPSESRNYVVKIPPELHRMGLPFGFPIEILKEIPPDENGVTVISMDHPEVKQFMKEFNQRIRA